MITEVCIKNFKCFTDLKIDDLARITLIGGENNVGKTSFLEALFLFYDRQPPNLILKQYGWRGLPSVNSDPEGMWAPIFRNRDLEKEMLIMVVSGGRELNAAYKYHPEPKLGLLEDTIDGREAVSPDSSPKRIVRTDMATFPIASLVIEYFDGSDLTLTSYCAIGPDGNPLIKHRGTIEGVKNVFYIPAKQWLNPKELANRFSRARKAGNEQCIFELATIIEPRLKNIELLTEGGEAAIHGNVGFGPQPISFLGGGLANMLNIVITTAQAQDGIVLIDEIENGIYRSLLPSIWQAMANYATQYDCQVIATTHSMECVQAAYDGLAKNQESLRYIRFDRDTNGTKAKVFDYEALGTAIEHSLDIR